MGNSLDKLHHPTSDAYSAEQALLNKQQISCGTAYPDCYSTMIDYLEFYGTFSSIRLYRALHTTMTIRLYWPKEMAAHADNSVMRRVKADVALKRRIVLRWAAISSGGMRPSSVVLPAVVRRRCKWRRTHYRRSQYTLRLPKDTSCKFPMFNQRCTTPSQAHHTHIHLLFYFITGRYRKFCLASPNACAMPT